MEATLEARASKGISWPALLDIFHWSGLRKLP
jgi:hypothetical protein